MSNLRFHRGLLLFMAGMFWPAPGTPAPSAPASAHVSATGTAPANVATPPKPTPFYKTYTYRGDRFRDPFVPLVGDTRTDQGNRPPQVASLVLRGIVMDARGRMALLTSGVSSYILRDGRLYDNLNRMVKGISGVIRKDSVLVIGADRTVRELTVTPPPVGNIY